MYCDILTYAEVNALPMYVVTRRRNVQTLIWIPSICILVQLYQDFVTASCESKISKLSKHNSFKRYQENIDCLDWILNITLKRGYHSPAYHFDDSLQPRGSYVKF